MLLCERRRDSNLGNVTLNDLKQDLFQADFKIEQR